MPGGWFQPFPENALEVLEEAAKHPEGLVVGLDALDDQVLSLQITVFFADFAEASGTGQQRIMRFDQVRDEVLCGHRTRTGFLDSGRTGQRLQPARRVMIQGANPFGNLVDCREKLLILGLKRGVELEKIWALDIPVCKVCLAHQCVGVCKEGLESFNNGVGILFRGGLRAHGNTWNWNHSKPE